MKDHFRMKKLSMKQETAHLTESRRDKAFRGFRNVVGPQPPTPGAETNFLPPGSIQGDEIEL